MILAKAAKATLSCDCNLIVLATVITIVNYNNKTFIAQANGYPYIGEPQQLMLHRPKGN
jgi:hypothetical protein